MSQLFDFSVSRASWAALLVSVLVFEACALYFQHIMSLSPCVMCIYERVAMMVVAIGAIVALVNPSSMFVRLLGYILWVSGSLAGTLLSLDHTAMQINPSPFSSCPIDVNFPSFMPLNDWFPWMFEAYGNCAEIVWSLWGLSMPQWLVFIFGTMFVVSIFFTCVELNSEKSRN